MALIGKPKATTGRLRRTLARTAAAIALAGSAVVSTASPASAVDYDVYHRADLNGQAGERWNGGCRTVTRQARWETPIEFRFWSPWDQPPAYLEAELTVHFCWTPGYWDDDNSTGTIDNVRGTFTVHGNGFHQVSEVLGPLDDEGIPIEPGDRHEQPVGRDASVMVQGTFNARACALGKAEVLCTDMVKHYVYIDLSETGRAGDELPGGSGFW